MVKRRQTGRFITEVHSNEVVDDRDCNCAKAPARNSALSRDAESVEGVLEIAGTSSQFYPFSPGEAVEDDVEINRPNICGRPVQRAEAPPLRVSHHPPTSYAGRAGGPFAHGLSAA